MHKFIQLTLRKYINKKEMALLWDLIWETFGLTKDALSDILHYLTRIQAKGIILTAKDKKQLKEQLRKIQTLCKEIEKLIAPDQTPN